MRPFPRPAFLLAAFLAALSPAAAAPAAPEPAPPAEDLADLERIEPEIPEILAEIPEVGQITREDFVNRLGKEINPWVRRPAGAVAMTALINDYLLDHRARLAAEEKDPKRRFQVAETEVDATIRRLLSEARKGDPSAGLRDLLVRARENYSNFRRRIRRDLVLRRIVSIDAALPPKEAEDPKRREDAREALKAKAAAENQIEYLKDEVPVGSGREPRVLRVYDREAYWSEYARHVVLQFDRAGLSALLDRMVDNLVAEAAFRRSGLSLSQTDLDARVKAILGAQSPLEGYGESPADVRGRVRMEMIYEKLAGPLKDDDVDLYFREHAERYDGTQVRAAHLLLAAVDPATGAPRDAEALREAERKIRRIADDIAAGRISFDDAVHKYSEDARSKDRKEFPGDLGYFTREAPGMEAFVSLAFDLNVPVNRVAGPVRSVKGWHLLKVMDRLPPPQADFDRVKERVRADLRAERMKARVEDLRRQWSVEVHVKFLSVPPSAAGSP